MSDNEPWAHLEPAARRERARRRRLVPGTALSIGVPVLIVAQHQRPSAYLMAAVAAVVLAVLTWREVRRIIEREPLELMQCDLYLGLPGAERDQVMTNIRRLTPSSEPHIRTLEYMRAAWLAWNAQVDLRPTVAGIALAGLLTVVGPTWPARLLCVTVLIGLCLWLVRRMTDVHAARRYVDAAPL